MTTVEYNKRSRSRRRADFPACNAQCGNDANAAWSAMKTHQYDPESRPRMPFRPSAIRGHSTVASNQSRPPGTQQRHVLRAHRRVRVLWRWVIWCKGLQIRPISAKELEIQPIRTVLPACTADGIKGVCLHFSTFLSMTRCRMDVDL